MRTDSNPFDIRVNAVPADAAITLSPLGQTLLGMAGVWSFGTAVSAGNGNAVLLNGVQVAGGFGDKIQQQAGNIFHHNLKNNWYQLDTSKTPPEWRAGAPA